MLFYPKKTTPSSNAFFALKTPIHRQLKPFKFLESPTTNSAYSVLQIFIRGVRKELRLLQDANAIIMVVTVRPPPSAAIILDAAPATLDFTWKREFA
jgi:hypothetical protein